MEKEKNNRSAISSFAFKFSIISFITNPTIKHLQKDKNSDKSKFKAAADDNINVTKMMIYVFDRTKNIVGKGENAGYQHFLLFPQCFQKAFSSGVLKVEIMW